MRSRVIESLEPWQRVILKVKVDFSTDCWNYQSPLNNKGYGQISWKDKGEKSGLAHRIIYENFKGPIPKGKCVCHSCDNPRCVNPAHLWLGSHGENMKDAFDKGRAKSTFTFAAFDGRKEKRREYQRQWQKEYRKRKREQL